MSNVIFLTNYLNGTKQTVTDLYCLTSSRKILTETVRNCFLKSWHWINLWISILSWNTGVPLSPECWLITVCLSSFYFNDWFLWFSARENRKACERFLLFLQKYHISYQLSQWHKTNSYWLVLFYEVSYRDSQKRLLQSWHWINLWISKLFWNTGIPLSPECWFNHRLLIQPLL